MLGSAVKPRRTSSGSGASKSSGTLSRPASQPKSRAASCTGGTRRATGSPREMITIASPARTRCSRRDSCVFASWTPTELVTRLGLLSHRRSRAGCSPCVQPRKMRVGRSPSSCWTVCPAPASGARRWPASTRRTACRLCWRISGATRCRWRWQERRRAGRARPSAPGPAQRPRTARSVFTRRTWEGSVNRSISGRIPRNPPRVRMYRIPRPVLPR